MCRQVATLLLNKDADPNILIPTHGVTPFHLVIGNDSEEFAEEVTKLFLRHGGNPNVRYNLNYNYNNPSYICKHKYNKCNIFLERMTE